MLPSCWRRRSSCCRKIRRSTIISATLIGKPAGSSRPAINGAARCNSSPKPIRRRRSRSSSIAASSSRRRPRRRAAAEGRRMARRWAAPAKLNLYLHVVGRRSDGYHLLDSLVAFAAPADEVIAEPAPALSLAVRGPYAAALADAPRDNLVWRAAERLAAQAGRPAAAALTLIKNLPVASGIGGGSGGAPP